MPVDRPRWRRSVDHWAYPWDAVWFTLHAANVSGNLPRGWHPNPADCVGLYSSSVGLQKPGWICELYT